jgi:hypothetical protein
MWFPSAVGPGLAAPSRNSSICPCSFAVELPEEYYPCEERRSSDLTLQTRKRSSLSWGSALGTGLLLSRILASSTQSTMNK